MTASSSSRPAAALPVVHGIPNCGSVKNAREWLATHDVAHVFHDFKKAGVPAARLPDWIAAVGWQKLVNRQGTTWRKLDPAVQAGITDAASATALMLAQPSVIKRPVIDWPDGGVSVGWDAAELAARSGR